MYKNLDGILLDLDSELEYDIMEDCFQLISSIVELHSNLEAVFEDEYEK